jgi:RsiW-degrading membrane proteinase PrsW (M82 family)
MPIMVRCSCGKELHARDDMAGKSGRCPGCGEILTFQQHTGQTKVIAKSSNPFAPPELARKRVEPEVLKNTGSTGTDGSSAKYMFDRPKAPPASPLPAAPLPGVTNVTGSSASTPRPVLFKNQRPERSVLLELRHLLLGIALIPLALSLFHPADDIVERIKTTISHQPKEIKAKLETLSKMEDTTRGDFLRDALDILPEHQLEGAHLPAITMTHWLYAIISAVVFLGVIVFLFPKGDASAGELLLSGLFTGVIGILLLLGVQWIAFAGFRFRGGGKAIIIFIILKFIAFSYLAALDPDCGFVLSLLGFTFGVGLLEELTKALPMFAKSDKLGWREAIAWGLASGVGFGVSEGISYAGSFYNGVTGADIYLIRFTSCVALHAIWAAAVGISIYRAKAAIAAVTETSSIAWAVLKVLFIPMLLHGLYDTFLKKDMPGAAFLTALFSFAWLAYQIERALCEEERGVNPQAIVA